MDPMESSDQQDVVEESQKLVDSLDKLRVSAESSSSNSKKKPFIIIVVGMEGSEKTSFLHRLVCHTVESKSRGYVLNLNPVVMSLPFVDNIDIRDTVKYEEVMKQYNSGANGGILTSLNLLATKLNKVVSMIEKRADQLDYVFVDTPGQIEISAWSASGSIITEAFASTFPTVFTYVVDTPHSTSPITFMNNMLYACSILGRTRLPLVLAFNKTDATDHKFALEWMEDFEVFRAALETENPYMSTLANRLSLSLYEFYRNIRSVGVSAISGAGMAEFFKAIEESAEEYVNTYKTDLDKRKAEKERLDEERKKQEMESSFLFASLPEGCISNIISSFTFPREACIVSMVSKSFDSAAKSDIVWEKFLPSDYSSLFPRSQHLSSKREIYFHICNNPVLLEDGKLSFWIDKATGKNCVMLAAMRCPLTLGGFPLNWQWIQIPQARFEKVAELLYVPWFEFHGEATTCLLSPRTFYAAYIVFKKAADFYGFEDLVFRAEYSVYHHAHMVGYACFDSNMKKKHVLMEGVWRKIMKPVEREDGWMELQIGQCFVDEAGPMNSKKIWMGLLSTERRATGGVIIQGFEIRPTKSEWWP